jgi:hypothetical protein
LDEFLTKNSLEKVVRSHECVNGYKATFAGKLVTVWGAPNYCDVSGNKGVVMKVAPEAEDTYLEFDPMPAERRKRPTADCSSII